MYQLPSGHQNSRGWALTAEDLGIVDLASEVRTEAMSASSTCSEDSWEFHDFNLSLEHEPRYLPGTSKLRRQYRCTLYDYYGQGVLLRRRPRRHTSRPRKPSNAVQPDVIDRLDDVGLIRYHHEGPYDAVYPERNRDRKTSAVEAVKNTTAETLKATPPERIRDCLDNHRPLEGVAVYASGGTDPNGRMYDYEEATNVISERDVFFQIPGLVSTICNSVTAIQ